MVRDFLDCHVQISDRTVWERDEGRRLTLDLCDKFSDKLLVGYVENN